jgi:hypothetical protein
MYRLAYRKTYRPTLARHQVTYNHSNLGQSLQVRQLLRRSLVQPKLTIGAPNDKYEHEADHVADQVMQMPDSLLQRQTLPEDEELIQAKSLCAQVAPLAQRQVSSLEDEGDWPQAKHLQDRSSSIASGVATIQRGTPQRLQRS